ncbi:hypothetical protein [Paraburkholderia sp. 22B1P]|uniref:hypothetical protein n=1 Tax=Paraburkholderia sp. 22B1P TaxID=3080498 RepID=UPI0030847BB6|nr:hypothetical protein PBP221_58460 [Paraburkholderia sp. 22B1P]
MVISPQSDFLDPNAVGSPYFGESIEESNTIANIRRLLDAAKERELADATSPRYWPIIAGKSTRSCEADAQYLLRLRKRGIYHNVLVGVAANLCKIASARAH